MTINFKQQELIDGVLSEIRSKFPGVEFISVTESLEEADSLWVWVTAPKNEEIESKLLKYVSKKSTDILMKYGYHILFIPTDKSENAIIAAT